MAGTAKLQRAGKIDKYFLENPQECIDAGHLFIEIAALNGNCSGNKKIDDYYKIDIYLNFLTDTDDVPVFRIDLRHVVEDMVLSHIDDPEGYRIIDENIKRRIKDFVIGLRYMADIVENRLF